MTGLALLLVLCFVSAASCARPNNVLVRPNELAISKHEVDAVNQDDSIPWTAGENEMFKGMTIEEARKYYLGTNLPTGEETEESKKRTYKNYLGLSDLPKNFDARQQWPGKTQREREEEEVAFSLEHEKPLSYPTSSFIIPSPWTVHHHRHLVIVRLKN